MLLIIEDNASRCNVWHELCRSFDFSANVVPNITEALKTIRVAQYAAMVIDIDSVPLSQISNEFVEQVRQIETQLNRGRMPIIAATTLDDSELEHLEHIDCFLQRPFLPEEFRRMLLCWAYKPQKPNLKILPRNPF